MSKRFTTSKRINVILGLLAVFLLILGTNRIDKRHFDTAQNAITTVYNDRVLTQSYIYKMNNLIHRKQHHVIDGSITSRTATNKEIETLIDLYAETQLTIKEAKTFDSFKNNFTKLKHQENSYHENTIVTVHHEFQNLSAVKDSFNDTIEALQADLNNLALIQVSESKNVTGVAQKSLDINKIMSNMEIYFLLVVGIIILVFTFYRVEKSK